MGIKWWHYDRKLGWGQMGYVGNLSLCELLRVSTISTLYHVAWQIKNLLRPIEIWLNFTHTQLCNSSRVIRIDQIEN